MNRHGRSTALLIPIRGDRTTSAAPAGAPVFALADAVVVALTDDGSCGTGLVLRSLDGLLWVYCHLSFRDPGIRPGALLTAAQWFGLVGSTGHSTGPHLHIGLQHSTLYPQQQAWFQSFAGSAFRWQGDPAPLAAPAVPRSRDVFAVEGEGDVVLFNR